MKKRATGEAATVGPRGALRGEPAHTRREAARVLTAGKDRHFKRRLNKKNKAMELQTTYVTLALRRLGVCVTEAEAREVALAVMRDVWESGCGRAYLAGVRRGRGEAMVGLCPTCLGVCVSRQTRDGEWVMDSML